MAFKSIVMSEKPVPHLTLNDWGARLSGLRNGADKRRNEAFRLRHDSKALRNITRIEGDWIHFTTDEALMDRITEIGVWRREIERTFKAILEEMKLLAIERENTERELNNLVTPIGVLSEVLTMRDSRLGAELTYDDADTEIKKELAILENNQRLLTDQVQRAWNKLSRLEDVKFRIGMELENKVEAEKMDFDQLALTSTSANITYKPDALRIPRNSCSYKGWVEHVKSIKQMAENELADTFAIREALFVSREKARNVLEAQQDRAEHNIRKRIFETQRARNELEWQQLRMREEMEKATCELETLQETLRQKTDSLKLAETRLENRAQRSGMELCMDLAHTALCKEVLQLRDIRQRLMAKIRDNKISFNRMAALVEKIDVDLLNKQHSLQTDMRAMDLRKRLKYGDFGKKQPCAAQTERNIVLTQMEDQVPKEY